MQRICLTPLLACLLLPACSGDDVGAPAEAIYVVPEHLDELSDEHFFDHPWPSDLRLEDGMPRFAGYPNPRQVKLIDEYLDATVGLAEGFSPTAAGFVRFTAPLDVTSLPPSPLGATDPAATVQLVDIDPSSPESGTRHLVSLSFWEPQGVYLQPNTLRFMPTLGFPLRPGTQYALVVTTGARAASGGPVEPSAHLRQVLGLEPADGARAAAREQLSPALQTLAGAGIAADQIAHLAVFRTGDPTAELQLVADHLHSEVPPPDFLSDGWGPVYGFYSDYTEYLGVYGPCPNYQAGEQPFAHYGDGGLFSYDASGRPEVVDYFDARFSLTVPKASKCPMPPAGYPIALYAHGTGGDYQNHKDFGQTLAQKCIASMGVDQIFHGTRPGAPATLEGISLIFFNFQNVHAARTNGRQSALDEVHRARLFTETGAVIPASVAAGGEEIRFDGSKVLFAGHSQGGLNGPLYLAIDGSARGGVLSGSGSSIGLTLLEKTQPEPSIANMVKTLVLRLSPEESGEYDLFHPMISLAQWLIDPLDAVYYARYTVNEPLAGNVPKSILMTEGIGPDGVGDHYTPPLGTEAQAIAMGLPLQLPGQHPIEQLQWGGPEPVTVPPEGLCGNLAGGAASGVLAQWIPAQGSDGHFVLFEIPEAREQAAEFLRRLADSPSGCVPAP